ncbi:MAG: hypothetical protein HFJ42_09415 [Clostridia bacterium]|nr:hypothetical protein [Clostridia bacterium]
MIMIPGYQFICEVCGKTFNSRGACYYHESICRQKRNQKEDCSLCNGTGYVKKWDQYGKTEVCGPYPTRFVKAPGWRYIRCPVCNKD